MSDPNLIMQRQIQELQDGGERLRKADVPPIYLPWSQRVLNSFPLASSGATWGEQPLPWAVNILAWYVSVFVSTTNDGSNFWTLALRESSGTLTASLTTAAVTVNTWTRLVVTSGITQPAGSSPRLVIIPTATLSPGAIFILPAVALLRTGN